MKNTDRSLNFQRLVDALLDTENPFPPKYLKYFSDLDRVQIDHLDQGWKALPDHARQEVICELLALGRRDTLLSFESFARYVLGDEDPFVRTCAVKILWEYESSDLAQVFARLCEGDPDAEVRTAAASGLGRFVFEGELDRISAELQNKVEACLARLLEHGETPREQQEALISLGYLNKTSVMQRIEQAYASQDEGWVASSVYAMGRSVNDRWIPDVLEKLSSRSPRIRAAAAYAAGELELKQALPLLIEMLEDIDVQVQYRAITALAQIGGERSRKELLARYNQAEDPELVQLLGEALERIEFWEEIGDLPFINYLDEEEGVEDMGELDAGDEDVGDEDEFSSGYFGDEDDLD
jgi:HEAT repeat protein